jgi:hypothetical protein
MTEQKHDDARGASHSDAELGTDRDNDRVRFLLGELVAQLGERDRDDGNAPGHHHEVPGVWDSDNGFLAGKKCAWCALWAEAKAAVPNAQDQPGRTG